MSNQIVCGEITLTDKYLLDGKCIMNHSRNGESLAYDTLEFDAHFNQAVYPKAADTQQFEVSNSDDLLDKNSLNFMVPFEREIVFLDAFSPGSVMAYTFDSKTIGKFYVQKVERIGRYKFRVSAYSAIGLLDNSMHYGGMYEGTTLGTILAEIFSGLTYSVDSAIASLKIYGWLPYDTKRNNLQQLTIATNIAIKIGSTGDIIITALSDAMLSAIGSPRTALGGNVKTDTPCTAVKIIEHNYTEGTESIVLCDSAFSTEEIIVFPEPAHSLTVTNGTIVESGANYAKIQGGGSVLLTGKKYNHTTKEIVYGTLTGGKSDKIVTVDKATLVNTLNSSKVSQRLYDVYSLPETIEQDIKVEDERPGDVVNTINPYTLDTEDAFLQRLEITMGGFLKGRGSFLKGFKPSGASSGYENKLIVSANGTFTVPAGVTEIRPILIGGGQGGKGGTNGSAGEQGSRGPGINSEPTGTNPFLPYAGNGGAGGQGGTGGIGGKINDLGPIAVTPGQTFTVTVGAGGTGGAVGTDGSVGGDTSFGAYSSSSGTPRAGGYTDITTGKAYAYSGVMGFNGAAGCGKNKPEPNYNFTYDGPTKSYGGQDGAWGSLYWYYLTYSGGTKKWLYGAGGAGGGGANNTLTLDRHGRTGGDGSAVFNGGNGFADGGAGGAGGKAGKGLDAVDYGSGGNGGHGGGGGGGGGSYNNPNGSSYEWPGPGGAGGAGGIGGNGKAGCVIVYY